jgi:hypothetical protein
VRLFLPSNYTSSGQNYKRLVKWLSSRRFILEKCAFYDKVYCWRPVWSFVQLRPICESHIGTSVRVRIHPEFGHLIFPPSIRDRKRPITSEQFKKRLKCVMTTRSSLRLPNRMVISRPVIDVIKHRKPTSEFNCVKTMYDRTAGSIRDDDSSLWCLF